MRPEEAESGIQSFAPAEPLSSPSDMNGLVKDFDWSTTPLGPAADWPDSLTAVVRILLTSRFAMWMAWGPELTFLYNDAYRQMTLGRKHPWALGRPAAEVWSEIWKDIGPRIQRVLATGEASWEEELFLILERNGYPEETYHTFSYSPLAGSDGQITGMLCVVMEDTTRVIGERQLLSLRTLAAALGEAISEQEVLASIERGLQANDKDLPFTLTYLFDESGTRLNLVCCTGIDADHPAACPVIETASPRSCWPIDQVLAEQRAVTVDLSNDFVDLPTGAWEKVPRLARLVPVARQGQDRPAGVLIAALNPYRQLDTAYAGFLDLIAGQIAASFASARAYEQERQRAEALAEIDRAKTAFFTNISHEFRTPLTLLLGPIEDTLAEHGLPPQALQRLTLAHRNSLRLLKLVNALLDFSRFEAGRISAVYEPLDLSTYTADLASVFRSAIERAGMKLIIDCPRLQEPVYVDREMWEKIVLNLLSNAFKFTLWGEIEVGLKSVGRTVELRVRDTGSGIAAEELPHIFERFYRVSEAQGRSYEGSGIGLALVQELVKLHGGTTRVNSEPGRGSTFTVSIPFGIAHLPPEDIRAARALASTATSPAAYVEEAMRWLPDGEVFDNAQEVMALPAVPSATDPREGVLAERSRILIADDNADMREYLRRLLAPQYDVEAVPDGEAAFQSALQRLPDLVVTDVMMPKLDGFGLLKALRGAARTATVPIMLLSARAGEESRLEGIAAGADDYVVKPFAARELVARVEARLLLSRMRRETEKALRQSEERFRTLVTATSNAVFRMSADWSEMTQLRGRQFMADHETPSRTWLQKFIHPEDQSRVLEVIDEAIRTKGIFELEHRVLRADGSLGWTFSRAIPLKNAQGEIIEWFGTASDVTERKRAEDALLRSEKLATLGRMAATIAHEINNPLEAVTNALYLARVNGEDPASVLQYLDMADGELKRVAHITRQTLGFYRESSAPAAVSLASVLDAAEDLLRAKIKAKRASIEKQYELDRQVAAVPGELRQVFSNLLANSLDAIEEQGTIKFRISKLTCPTNGRRPRIRVTVADNGKGIDAATLPRVFEPLFTTKEATGSGLGLWVSKQIIEKHGGYIRIRSSPRKPRQGTVISIFLPAIEAPASEAAAAS
jgi:signal transduction histidine kinase